MELEPSLFDAAALKRADFAARQSMPRQVRWEHNAVKRYVRGFGGSVAAVMAAYDRRTGEGDRLTVVDMLSVYPDVRHQLVCRMFKGLWREPVSRWLAGSKRCRLLAAFTRSTAELDCDERQPVLVTKLSQLYPLGKPAAVFETTSLDVPGLLLNFGSVKLGVCAFDQFVKRCSIS